MKNSLEKIIILFRKKVDFWQLIPLLVCLRGLVYISKRLSDPVSVDAEQTYLPAARALLEEGWSFFGMSESFRVVPLAYMWPALWGVDPYWIRIANGGLWIACVFFIWRTVEILGGRWAAAFALLLLATHPDLLRYFPTELTEPIFLFGLTGWMYFTTRIVVFGQANRKVIICSALGLTITLLSRPVLQLSIPLAISIGITLLIVWRKASEHSAKAIASQRIRTLLSSWTLALILPTILVVKNGLLFDLWGLGTGSGTGIYLGMHPLTQGTEPGFLGFKFDVNGLAYLTTGNGDHLSLGADNALRAAGFAQLASLSIPEALYFFSRKLWWWLAHHPSPIESRGSWLRQIRLFELTAIGLALFNLFQLWLQRRSQKTISQRLHGDDFISNQGSTLAMCGLLAGFFGLLLLQLLPILYNSRYSSALLEPWLIVLSSVSVVHLFNLFKLSFTINTTEWSFSLKSIQGSLARNIIYIALLILVPALIYNTVRSIEFVRIDAKNTGGTQEVRYWSDPSTIRSQGMERQGENWIITQTPSVLMLDFDQNDIDAIKKLSLYNALWRIRLTASGPGSCKKLQIYQQQKNGKISFPIDRLPNETFIDLNNEEQTIFIHANNQMRPTSPGSLRLTFHCPIGSSIHWRDLTLLESIYAKDSAHRISTHLSIQKPLNSSIN